MFDFGVMCPKVKWKENPILYSSTKCERGGTKFQVKVATIYKFHLFTLLISQYKGMLQHRAFTNCTHKLTSRGWSGAVFSGFQMTIDTLKRSKLKFTFFNFKKKNLGEMFCLASNRALCCIFYHTYVIPFKCSTIWMRFCSFKDAVIFRLLNIDTKA